MIKRLVVLAVILAPAVAYADCGEPWYIPVTRCDMEQMEQERHNLAMEDAARDEALARDHAEFDREQAAYEARLAEIERNRILGDIESDLRMQNQLSFYNNTYRGYRPY